MRDCIAPDFASLTLFLSLSLLASHQELLQSMPLPGAEEEAGKRSSFSSFFQSPFSLSLRPASSSGLMLLLRLRNTCEAGAEALSTS